MVFPTSAANRGAKARPERAENLARRAPVASDARTVSSSPTNHPRSLRQARATRTAVTSGVARSTFAKTLGRGVRRARGVRRGDHLGGGRGRDVVRRRCVDANRRRGERAGETSRLVPRPARRRREPRRHLLSRRLRRTHRPRASRTHLTSRATSAATERRNVTPGSPRVAASTTSSRSYASSGSAPPNTPPPRSPPPPQGPPRWLSRRLPPRDALESSPRRSR